MAYILKRKKKDGSFSHMAIVRIKREGKIIYQESKTFSREALARDWHSRRSLELKKPDALAKVMAGGASLGALTGKYIDQFETVSKWQRSKQAGLKALRDGPLAGEDAVNLTPARLIEHVRQRRAGGAGPATCANDLVWVGVVLRAAKSVWELPVDPNVVVTARSACRELKLVGKSRRRDRLPTYEELVLLDEYFTQREARERSEYPMRHIMWFAIYSARRAAEICRIERADNDVHEHTGLVRDAKHPKHKEGNHRRFNYTPEAWEIMEMQPTGSDYIFPFDEKTVSAYFTNACAMVGIDDLHLHDLRHEATTRLFEKGLGIPQVAAVTLHESWNELKRYTHIERRKRELFEAPFLSAPQKPKRKAKR
jgi:integrase